MTVVVVFPSAGGVVSVTGSVVAGAPSPVASVCSMMGSLSMVSGGSDPFTKSFTNINISAAVVALEWRMRSAMPAGMNWQWRRVMVDELGTVCSLGQGSMAASSCVEAAFRMLSYVSNGTWALL